MKLSRLKKIIKESIRQIQNEQVIPGGGSQQANSCALPVGSLINGPYPNQFNPAVWKNKWEAFKASNNLGCPWVKNKYVGWKSKLTVLHSKPYPKCNKKWQAQLQFKLQHVQAMHSQCI